MPPRNRSHNSKKKSMGASLEMAQFLDAGANKIKKRIRDLERLLRKKKDILPDTVIIEKERTLDALRLELENAELKTKAKKYSTKYHMVRFFERKKALRKYNQILKQYNNDKSNESLKEQLNERKIDLCYIANFPRTEKYIALYANDDSVDSDKSANKKENHIRKLIIEQMENDSLPISFDDILAGKKLEKNHSGISTKSIENDTNVDNESDDNEDDFFE